MMGIDGLLVPIRCATSNRPKRRCLALVTVLVLGGVATGNRAEDLGTVGETYAIAEPHLLSYIEQTLREKEKSGELANLEEQAKRRVIESIRNPKPLAGIRPTQTARTFYFDPSIKVEQNITDDKGNIIVPAGTTKNPLEVVSLSKHLLFFDGRDPQQVRDARALIDHYGGRGEATLMARAYPDLFEAWLRVVSQEGMRLRIDEFKVGR